MAKFISVHHRTKNLRFLINTERIVTIWETRIDDNFAWTNITTENKTFEVAETEQDILDKMG